MTSGPPKIASSGCASIATNLACSILLREPTRLWHASPFGRCGSLVFPCIPSSKQCSWWSRGSKLCWFTLRSRSLAILRTGWKSCRSGLVACRYPSRRSLRRDHQFMMMKRCGIRNPCLAGGRIALQHCQRLPLRPFFMRTCRRSRWRRRTSRLWKFSRAHHLWFLRNVLLWIKAMEKAGRFQFATWSHQCLLWSNERQRQKRLAKIFRRCWISPKLEHLWLTCLLIWRRS